MPRARTINLKAGKQADFKIYEGAKHGFYNDTRPEAYNAEAATDAWQRTLDFFRDDEFAQRLRAGLGIGLRHRAGGRREKIYVGERQLRLAQSRVGAVERRPRFDRTVELHDPARHRRDRAVERAVGPGPEVTLLGVVRKAAFVTPRPSCSSSTATDVWSSICDGVVHGTASPTAIASRC